MYILDIFYTGHYFEIIIICVFNHSWHLVVNIIALLGRVATQ